MSAGAFSWQVSCSLQLTAQSFHKSPPPPTLPTCMLQYASLCVNDCVADLFDAVEALENAGEVTTCRPNSRLVLTIATLTRPPLVSLPTPTHTHTYTLTHTHTHTHAHTHTHSLSPIPTTQAVYRHLLPASPPQSVCFTSCPFRASSCPSSAPIRPAVALLRTCTSAAPSLHTCMRLCRARPTSPLPTALKCRHTAAALQTSSQSWRYPRECVCVCEYV